MKNNNKDDAYYLKKLSPIWISSSHMDSIIDKSQMTEEDIKLVPFGVCGSNHPKKVKPTEIAEKDYDEFSAYMRKKLAPVPDNLTTKEASELTGYCVRFICRVILSGKLYAVRVGSEYRIPKSKLIDFLATAQIDRKTEWHKEMIEKYLSKK